MKTSSTENIIQKFISKWSMMISLWFTKNFNFLDSSTLLLFGSAFTSQMNRARITHHHYFGANNILYMKVNCRIGLPKSIITDNIIYFDSTQFHNFCIRWWINLHFASGAHFRSKGLTKAINKQILDTLQKSVGDSKGDWIDKQFKVLWS